MIESGDIHAQINDSNGMVRFLHDSSQFNNAETAALLDEQIRKCTQLAAKLQAVHDSVSARRSGLSGRVGAWHSGWSGCQRTVHAELGRAAADIPNLHVRVRVCVARTHAFMRLLLRWSATASTSRKSHGWTGLGSRRPRRKWPAQLGCTSLERSWPSPRCVLPSLVLLVLGGNV